MKHIISNKEIEKKINENQLMFLIYIFLSMMYSFISYTDLRLIGLCVVCGMFSIIFHMDLKYWQSKYTLLNIEKIMDEKEKLEND